MRDYVLELAAGKSGLNAKLNIIREYLQAFVLRILHQQGFFKTSAFLGGTALRFLYGLPRFSEDLDFSAAGKDRIAMADTAKKIETELLSAGYTIEITANDSKVVQQAMIKFSRLLYDAGISPLPGQKFSIKLEIDTNPPDGATTETMIVNKYFPLAFLTYDLPSLFTGKLNALLSRKYTKGRDYFDIGWYLSKWNDIVPNFGLLANGLTQTGWKKEKIDKDNWKTVLYDTVAHADWNLVRKDVIRFLENPSDMDIFTRENILRLIHKK